MTFRRGPFRRPQSGQSLLEATLVLMVFFAMLLGVVDCGQVVFAHEALVERVREAVRWGSVRQFDGTGEQVANMVLYDRPDGPSAPGSGYLGLTRDNVRVRYQAPSAERPDDETLTVAIVNYESHFFSPWIAKTVINPRPVLISAPMSYRPAKEQ